MYFTFTTNSQTLSEDLLDEILEQGCCFYIEPVDDEAPVPYDCGWEIENGKLILEGGVGPSGYGSMRIEIPVQDAAGMYRIYMDLDDEPELVQVMIELGYEQDN